MTGRKNVGLCVAFLQIAASFNLHVYYAAWHLATHMHCACAIPGRPHGIRIRTASHPHPPHPSLIS